MMLSFPGAHKLHPQVCALIPDPLDAGVRHVGEVLAEYALKCAVVREDRGGVWVAAEVVLAPSDGVRHSQGFQLEGGKPHLGWGGGTGAALCHPAASG